MTEPTDGGERRLERSEQEKSGPSILEFLGKVLDQLSLSAWLPATMLVGVESLLAQIHGGERLDVGAAVSRLAKQPLGVLLVIAFALVLATMMIQAFAFEFIRLLEGYWGAGRLRSLLADVRIKSHVKRRKRLEIILDATERTAFGLARTQMLTDHVRRPLIDVLELDVVGGAVDDYSAYSENIKEEARSMGWEASAPPWILRRRDAIQARLSVLPEAYRTLPTALGNTLRSFEDSLALADNGDLQGFVMRNYERISPTLMLRHAQSRTRLDMYCSLVFVFEIVALSCVPALWRFGPWHMPTFAGAVLFLVLARVSYGAAKASARSYGSVLHAVDAQVSAAVEAQPK